jgi:DNA primase
MSAIDEIKQKIDITEIIGQYVQLTKSGRTFRAPCPFHSEKKPSFFVYPEQQTWHCFGACNTGGDVFSFIMKKEGLEFKDALALLAEKTGVILPSAAKFEAEDKTRARYFQMNQAAAQYFQNLLLNSPAAAKARRYLESRGLNAKAISDFQLGYSLPGWEALKGYLVEKGYGEQDLLAVGLLVQSEGQSQTHDRFRDHIMFPIMDDRGRTLGFGARVLDDSLPKYVNSPQSPVFDKSGSLYGIHLAKAAIRQSNLAVLVEGYMDVIVAHQFGFANVIAPMGVAITEKQINQIKKLTHNIALALDPDAAGEDAAMRCINYENALDAEVKVISLPTGQDPDEVIKEDIRQWQNHVDKAIPVIEYTINVITKKLDMKSSQGKTEAANRLLPIIAEVKAGTRQYDYLTKLSLAIGIEDKKLEAALGRYKNDRKARETRSQAIQKATRTIRSSPMEEYALALLIQHPDIKKSASDEPGLLPEYFENSENREIFSRLLETEVSGNIEELFDPITRNHYESLQARSLPDNQIQEKYRDCVLRLKERYLRSLQQKQSEVLALEAESGDRTAVLAKLEEQGTIINKELAKIFALRARTHGEVEK